MRVTRIVLLLAVAVGVFGAAWGQATRSKPSATARKPAARAVSPNTIATVGGVPILRSTFEERFRMAEQNYRQQGGTIPAEAVPIMRRQVLEGLIREKLLLLEARRRGLSLSAEEAEREIRKDPAFLTNGRFDEAKYLAIKSSQPERFQSAIAELQGTMPAIRLRDRLRRENAPDSARLRDRISDELSTVSIEYLGLRDSDFGGEAPEPTEAEVLAHHREHANEHRLPEEVHVSILTVGQPPLASGLQGNATTRRAWEARMERTADSLLAALKRGAPFEGVASLYGGLRKETIQRGGRFPRYWSDPGRAQEPLFSASRGTIVSSSFPSSQGRLIVRVDEHRPARVAPLREVAGTIRNSLRESRRRAIEDRELRALYSSSRDELKGNAYRIRYAAVDTSTFPVPEPTESEMDRYYRGHQADYATLDRATTSVITVPFAQAKPDVRRRMLHERRVQGATRAAEQILQAWKAGKRDAKLERLALVREVGLVPAGGEVDTGAAGRVLTDSLATKTPTSGVVPYHRGFVAYHTVQTVRDHLPEYEAVRPVLARRWSESYAAREEEEARKLFEADPKRFRNDNVIYFSRLMVPIPQVFDVPLSQEEVETWHRTHPDRFGAPELVRVRHILVTPEDGSDKADAKARETADEVMKKLRAGEDFATLALKYSDDEATKSNGGDIGVIRPGMMVPEFEAIAFSMDQGELRGPVRTEAGWDILECLSHVPAEIIPLKYCYANVAVEAARSKGRLIARYRADSLLRGIKTVTQARAAVKKTGFLHYPNDHVVGTPMPTRDIQTYIRRVEKLKPGEIYPEVQEYAGMGYAITWMDSAGSSRTPSWGEQVRERAIAILREEKIERKRAAKRAEIDSLLRRGWSFDSVAALWGGPELHGPEGPGKPLAGLGGADRLDSLAFGGEGRSPVLRLGALTEWIAFPGGIARLRLVDRQPPDPSELAARFETDYRTELERNFRSVFERIQRNFPVVIHDPDLKLVELPSLEAS